MRVLIVLSVVVALIGVFSLSEATVGVGLVALACLLGIFARIAQASNYHSKLLDKEKK